MGNLEVARSRKRVAIRALTLWCVALGVAFTAQLSLTSHGGMILLGAALYAVAAVMGIAAARVVEQCSPAAHSAEDPVNMDRRPASLPIASAAGGLHPLVLLAPGLSAVSLSLAFSQVWKAYPQTLALWAAGLVLLAAGVGRWDGLRWNPRLQLCRPVLSVETVALVGIVAVAVALRWTDLVRLPPNVHGDEGAVGEEARRVLYGQVPNLFSVGWYGIPYMSFALRAVSMAIFGDNLYGLRMGSVMQGALSVLLLYLLVRRLFTVRIAAMAAFLLAVSQWHIHYSRIGIDYIQALVAELLLFYLLVRGVQTRRRIDFLLGGFSAGLCLNMYFAARVGPVIAALYLLHKVLSERGFLGRYRQQLLVLVIGALAFFAPMLAFYLHDSSGFFGRTQGVFIFTQQNLAHSYSAYNVSTWQDVLRVQVVHTALAFNQRGETSLQYGQRAPLLDFWSGPLFVLGLAIATLSLRRAHFFLVTSWFWLTVIVGSVLTLDALASPRLVVIIPVLFIFAALFLDVGWRAAAALSDRRGTYGAAAMVTAALALSTWANFTDYFQTYAQRFMPAGFPTVMSCFVASINDQYRVYLMGRSDTSLKYETPRFLIPGADGVDVRDKPLPLPIMEVPESKGIAFIIDDSAPDAAQRLAAIESVYPGGKQQRHKATNGVPLFDSYLVERDALVAAATGNIIDPAKPTVLPESVGISPGKAAAILGGGEGLIDLSAPSLGLLAALFLASVWATWRTGSGTTLR